MHKLIILVFLFLYIPVADAQKAELRAADSLDEAGNAVAALVIRQQLTRQHAEPAMVLLQWQTIGRVFKNNKDPRTVATLRQGLIWSASCNDSLSAVARLSFFRQLWQHYLADKQLDSALYYAQWCLKDRAMLAAGAFHSARALMETGSMIWEAEGALAAIPYYESAATIASASTVMPDDFRGLIFNDLAFAYDEVGYTHQVVRNYEKAQQIWSEKTPAHISYNATVLQNLTGSLCAYGDQRRAHHYLAVFREYFKKQIEPDSTAWSKESPDDDTYYATLDMFLAHVNVYVQTGASGEVVRYLDLLNSLYKNNPQPERRAAGRAHLFFSTENAGIHFRKNKQFSLAEKYFDRLEQMTYDGFTRMKTMADMGILRYDQARYGEAGKYIDRALQYLPEKAAGLSYYMLTVLRSELFALAGNQDSSLAFQQRLYNRMLLADTASADFNTLSITAFDNNVNTFRHISILLKSAKTFGLLYQQTSKPLFAKHEALFYRLAAEMFSRYYQKGFYNSNLDEYSKEINEGLLATSLKISDPRQLTTVLDLVENNESQHLWRKFSDRHAEHINIPFELINRRNMLLLQKKADDASSIISDSVQGQLEEVNNIIRDKYGSFSAMTNDRFSVTGLQKHMTDDERIFRYIVAEKNVYVFIIRKQQLSLHLAGPAENIKAAILQYTNDITERKETRKTGAYLHRLLVQPLSAGSDKQLLTIAAHDFLAYLPFESLVPAGDTKPLLFKYIVRYTYSLRMMTMPETKVSGEKMAAFAPAYTEGSALYFNTQESRYAADATGGDVFENAKADRKQFLSSIGRYGLYHLAMHAEIDERDYEQSYFIFSGDERLYFHELYRLNIPASLAVLSACNTGKGVMENGEGFMSLSRAFTYAGVRATVHSLWEVTDKETAQLMRIFYRNLSRGMRKDHALWLAKTEFIKMYPEKAHPYFWAGLVLNGDPAPSFNSSYLNYPLAGLVVLLISAFSGYWFYRRSRSKASA